ncbi:MAG: pilus assembly protein TadG-related protein [Rhodobacterales bacterium]
MVIFSLILFMIILFVGALGVDLMRFENERSKLQSTLDRAVLAAADIDQSLDPSFVVNEYFTKSGFPDSVTGVQVSEALGFRSVSATARKQVGTHLLHMLGVDTLSAPAAGAAEQRVDNVEISLVLDISGSMAFNDRMTNLRSAGRDFIDAIFENAAENKVSLSIVPYNGQVNVGPDLIDKYNITQRHNTSFCVDLPASVYTTAALSRTLAMPQHVHADTYNGSNTSTSYSEHLMTPATANRWCDAEPANRIRVHNNNVTNLKNQITALQPIGATSIDAGMRWGAALLDPSARGVVSELVSEGKVISAFNGRPLNYGDPDVLKVLVLMTDGEHWPNEFVNGAYRYGPSNVYRSDMDNYYSIHHPNVNLTNKYWVPHLGAWHSGPWTGSTSTTTCSWWSCKTTTVYGNAVQLTWQQVWQQLRVQWAAQHFFSRAFNEPLSTSINRLRTREGTLIGAGPHEVSTMNNRLLALCDKVKQQGIVVYTVAFEAPSGGSNLLRNCASSSNHAFDVNGLEIRSAFASIATSIRKLRLTQ